MDEQSRLVIVASRTWALLRGADRRMHAADTTGGSDMRYAATPIAPISELIAEKTGRLFLHFFGPGARLPFSLLNAA
jgi:hypothetical protein